MKTSNSSPKEILLNHYLIRLKKNPKYSLRAFARDLGISSGRLHGILGSEDVSSLKVLERIKSSLKLSEDEYLELVQANDFLKVRKSQTQADLVLLEEKISLVGDWIYFAIMTLIEIYPKMIDPDEIASRLNVSNERIEKALLFLEKLGAIEKSGDTYVCFAKRIATMTDVPSKVIRESHKQKLQIAMDLLDEVHLTLRDYSHITMAVDVKNIPKAKKSIQTFRRRLAQILESGSPTEVYTLNVQLLPLTKAATNE